MPAHGMLGHGMEASGLPLSSPVTGNYPGDSRFYTKAKLSLLEELKSHGSQVAIQG